MNAPRQGLYAALLAVSFVLHAILMIQGAAHQLALTRQAQGELMLNQLATDVLPPLMGHDAVGLALLMNRYGSRLDVAKLHIMDAEGRVLATGGQAPTRAGEVFARKIAVDQKNAGQLQLVMMEPSRGELVRAQVIPLLLSLLLHVLLWLLYRVVARQALLEPVVEPAKLPETSPAPEALTPVAALAVPDAVVLHIAFDDPRQLLDTLSPSLAEPYFLLCQTLLEQAIKTFAQLQPVSAPNVRIQQRFSASGAKVGLHGAPDDVLAEYAILLGSLINLLTDVVYRRHRESKHFALYTRVAVAAAQHQQTAEQLAASLLQHAKPNRVVVHVGEPVLTQLLRTCPLSALEHPVNVQMREAMHVDGLSAAQAQQVSEARAKILGAKREAV